MGQPVRLAEYGVSRERGFLPLEDPCRRLTHVLFGAWEEFAAALPSLISAGAVREAINRLPALDPVEVEHAFGNDAERERWMQVVSFAGSAWVWGQEPLPNAELPAHLAALLVAISSYFGRPPIMAYVSYNLCNWRRLNPEGPIALGNICRLINFQGVQDEEWFGNVHVAIEAAAGPGLGAVEDLQAATAAGEAVAAEAALRDLAFSIQRMRAIFLRMRERADPFIFQERMRIYMQGWTHENLPHGVSYPSALSEPQRLYGETGAQSAILPAFDAALGIPTEAGVDGSSSPAAGLVSYLQELRAYMPRGHAELIEAIGKGPDARAFAASVGGSLGAAFDAAVTELYRFRGLHLHLVMDFVRRWDTRSDEEVTGTGGTAFMPYLKSHRAATGAHRLGAPMAEATSKL